MRSLKEQIWQLLTNSFLRPLEAFNKMSAFVKGNWVSQGLLCNSILLLVTPEYSVTWEEMLLPSTPWLLFSNTSQDGLFLLLTHGPLVYQDTQIFFCKSPFHPVNLQPALPYWVIPSHDDILEVHIVPISPWLQHIKDPLSKTFASPSV